MTEVRGLSGVRVTRTLTVAGPIGLHGRPSAAIARIVGNSLSVAWFRYSGPSGSGFRIPPEIRQCAAVLKSNALSHTGRRSLPESTAEASYMTGEENRGMGGLLLLGVPHGAQVEVEVTGPDAHVVMGKVSSIIEGRVGDFARATRKRAEP